MNLLTHQSEAIEKLNRFKVGALFMSPGTGKTRVAYNLVKSAPNIDYVLWITPFQTKANLKAEIDVCGGLDNLDIVGIESISSSDKLYLSLRAKVPARNTFIVMDESLKIKNWEAKRTKRAIELAKMSSYRIVLNGTPITKNLLDLWAQMEFLSPKILNMDLRRFKHTFCETVTKYDYSRGYMVKQEYIKGYHNVDYLQSLIRHYVYGCDLKLDVSKLNKTVRYELTDTERDEYKAIKQHYLDLAAILGLQNNIFLEMTQKLQHSYCCAAQKFDLLKDIVAKHGDDVIVYCKYIKSSEAVRELLPRATVLTYGKHSFGLNLQDKKVIVYFDKTFDYAHRVQSSYRIYRMGQEGDCIYYDFTGDVGLEAMIDENIDRKQSLLEYLKTKTVDQLKEEL